MQPLSASSRLLVEAAGPVHEAAQGRCRCDDAAAASLSMDQAEVGEARESLSNDAARDPEPLLQFLLGGERVPGNEDLVLDLLVQDVADLHVQRTSVTAVDPSLQPLG